MQLALVDNAVRDSNAVNRVQLVLMLVEGCAVATLLVLYMWWLQHRVTQQRYRVYSVFLTVPVGMIRALASKTISISQGSDSEVRGAGRGWVESGRGPEGGQTGA